MCLSSSKCFPYLTGMKMGKNPIIFIGGWILALCSYDVRAQPPGFVNIKEHIPDVVVELKYYSNDNFIGDTIDGYFSNKGFITFEAAKALVNIQKDLKKEGIGLKLFDAYRPQSAVNHFIRWAGDHSDTLMKRTFYPEVDKASLFEKGYISRRSGHSRGSTVDLTIIYLTGPKKGQELDMGTPFDFFGRESWSESPLVTAEQKKNRMLLREVMERHGFKGIRTEWWHFTLINEPYPDTHFDFPVR